MFHSTNRINSHFLNSVTFKGNISALGFLVNAQLSSLLKHPWGNVVILLDSTKSYATTEQHIRVKLCSTTTGGSLYPGQQTHFSKHSIIVSKQELHFGLGGLLFLAALHLDSFFLKLYNRKQFQLQNVCHRVCFQVERTEELLLFVSWSSAH